MRHGACVWHAPQARAKEMLAQLQWSSTVDIGLCGKFGHPVPCDATDSTGRVVTRDSSLGRFGGGDGASAGPLGSVSCCSMMAVGHRGDSDVVTTGSAVADSVSYLVLSCGGCICFSYHASSSCRETFSNLSGRCE